ncbi:MAG: hemolysin family protein [Candidatus Peribacteraceae bacterium]
MLELLLLASLFVAASGFFAMIDAAILNVSPAEVEVLITRKAWGARELKSLLRHTTRAIIVIVICTNMTNILGPILVGRKAVDLFGSEAIGVITAILTFATILFSEIIPKSIGAHYAPTISRVIAPVLQISVLILFPIVFIFERIARLFKSGHRHVGTEEQIRALANIGRGAGHIDADERELIHRAFVLNDRMVRDILSPASTMVTIKTDATVLDAARIVFHHHYSRYPLVQNDGSVIGYALSRDVLEALANGRRDAPVSTLKRKVLVVQAGLRCDELLNLLRRTNAQLAIVQDGQTVVGLVTLEDTLEELVGDIRDEGDVGSTPQEATTLS